MAYFPTGAQARERAQNNNTLAQQISIMEISCIRCYCKQVRLQQLLATPQAQ